MSVASLPLGIDIGYEGPRVVLNLEGKLLPLDSRLFSQLRDPWLVPVFPPRVEALRIPRFYSLKALLGRMEQLDFGTQKLRKARFVLRDVFALLGRIAAEGFERPLGRVVICTPAFFSERQRHFLLQCALAGGVRDAHLLDENMAGAIFHRDQLGPGLALLVNLGFENCEVALVELGDGGLEGKSYRQCWAASGLSLSNVILKSILFSLNQEQSGSLVEHLSPAGWLKLWELSEQSKISLTLMKDYQMILDQGLTGLDRHLSIQFNNQDLNAVLISSFDALMATITDLLAEASVPEGHLNKVVICGGGAGIPLIRRLFRDRFSQKVIIGAPRSEVFGCAQWARLAGDREDSAAPVPVPVPRANEEVEKGDSLIRGVVETVSGEKLKNRLGGQAVTVATSSVVELVREKAVKLQAASKKEDLFHYLGDLNEIVREFSVASGARVTALPKTEPESGTSKEQFTAAYQTRIKGYFNQIRDILNQATKASSPQAMGVLFDRAVSISHNIELWARQYNDQKRLLGAVEVHVTSVRLLLEATAWDGLEETPFILSDKWLKCAMRTVQENRLDVKRTSLGEQLGSLYLTRIRHLATHKDLQKASLLKRDYGALFGERDPLTLRLERALHKQPARE